MLRVIHHIVCDAERGIGSWCALDLELACQQVFGRPEEDSLPPPFGCSTHPEARAWSIKDEERRIRDDGRLVDGHIVISNHLKLIKAHASLQKNTLALCFLGKEEMMQRDMSITLDPSSTRIDPTKKQNQRLFFIVKLNHRVGF